MNLTAFSIQKNRITFTVLATIMLLGITLYQSLPRDSMPPYTVRVASVVSFFPGASPERVELLVTDKVEKVAQELPELKEVSSTSRTELSVVKVELKDEVPPEKMQAVWDRLRRKLASIQGLPQGVVPDLKDDGIGEVYGIVVGLTSDGYSYTEMKDYADDIRDALIKLPDAAKVELGGAQEERIFIEFDNAVLNQYGITASMLKNSIAATNILSSGGQVNLKDERIILEPSGNFNSVEDIENTLIAIGGSQGQLLAIGDITEVKKGYIDPPKQRVRVNGKDAISLHVSLKEGSNVIALGEDINRVVAEWQQRLPVGLELQRLASLDTYIDVKIDDFVVNLLQSVGIVLLVMLVFLGLRSGSIIASLIPIVVIMTLMLMGMLGMGLNQVTLAALIMALGMMVDNAIVVAETIMVKMEQGVPKKQAAIDACSELFTPLLISTLTTSAAFLSFFLAQSTMGDIVGPIFVVISLALLSSWILALTVITLFCYLFLKANSGEKKESFIDRVIYALKVRYQVLIVWALTHRAQVLAGILVLFLLSLYGFTKIPFVFFADSDRNMITVDINLPQGTRLESTSEVVGTIEGFIRDSLQDSPGSTRGVIDWSSYIGEGPESYDLGYSPDEANSSYAHMLVNTSDFSMNNAMIERLDAFCFREFPNADVKVSALGSGGGGTPIEIKVSGPDPDRLAEIAATVKGRLSQIAATKNVKDDWGPKSKKFVVDIDPNRAQLAGISNQDIATSVQTALDGFVTGEYREEDKSIPIVMREDRNQQQSLEALETMNIYSQSTGRSVPLLQVARIVPEWQYSKIKRLDLIRTVIVSSELRADGNASAITAEIRPWLEEQQADWGADYRYTFGGDAENTAENMGAVVKYLPLSGFIIVLLLIIQFNSFRKMAMVCLTIPLAIIGVVMGLLAFREAFGFMPFLGVISLAGIVINNAIVLIDRMEIEQRDLGRSEQDAVITACLQRFRPILLATFTTVLGLIPLYISGGEMWSGMAVAIMVGLLFGTIITLIFIPTFYSVVYRVGYREYRFDPKFLEET